jgi:ketosteroid isomerase-like protein
VSQQNLDAIERAYAAWNRNDLSGTLEIVSGDFEFWPLPGFLDIEDVYRGKDGWTRFFETWRQAWTTIDLVVDRLEDLGDRAFALVSFDGVGRLSGVSVKLPVGHVWSMRGGLAVRLDALQPEEAAKAAGVSEWVLRRKRQAQLGASVRAA